MLRLPHGLETEQRLAMALLPLRCAHKRTRGAQSILPVLLAGAAALLTGCGATNARHIPAFNAAPSAEAAPSVDIATWPTQGPAASTRISTYATVQTNPTNAQFLLAALPLRDSDWESATEISSALTDATLADDGSGGGALGSGDDQSAHERTQQGLTAAGGLSVAGLPTTTNNETIDGLSAWQFYGSAPRGDTPNGVHAGSSFNEGAVSNLRVQPRAFSAAFGGAGALTTVLTRGGSDHLHGSAFGLLRESAWAATNPFSLVTRYSAPADAAYTAADATVYPAKPNDTLGQFGAALGGPIPSVFLPRRWHNRVQAFGSFEAQLRSNPVISSPAIASFFELTPEQLTLLANRGISPTETSAALNYLDSFMGTVQRNSTRLLGFARLDAEPGTRDHLTATWLGNRFHSPAGSGFASNSDAVMPRSVDSVGDAFLNVSAASFSWRHQINRRWINNLQAQFARDLEYEQPRAPLATEPDIAPNGYAPQISIGPNGFTYGTPSNLGRIAYPDEERIQVAETLAAAFGHHLLVFGGDWSRIHDRTATETNTDGSFSYDSGVINGYDGGLVDWITDDILNVHAYPNGGCPKSPANQPHYFCFHSFTQTFGTTQTQFATHEIAGFAEDTWRAYSGLTISFGVRGEYTLLPMPQAQNVALDAGLLSVLNANDPRLGTTATFPEDRNNFGPRLGIVWAGRVLAIRLGYGVFFGRVPGATIATALADTALDSSVRRVRITPTTETNCPQAPTVGFGYPCDFGDTSNTPPSAVIETTTADVFAHRFRLPVVQRANLSLEHTFGQIATLRLGYAGAIATQLPATVDLNIAPSTQLARYQIQGGSGWRGLTSGETFVVPLYTTRLLPQYGPVIAIVSNANATFHSGDAELRLHWRGLLARTSYTFSHAIDYGPLSSATPSQMTQFDPFANGYDKSRSSLDFTHRFTGVLVARTGQRNFRAHWLRLAASGWTLSAIGLAGSGAPYGYQIFGGNYLSGGRDTINGAGGATYLPTVGRNTLRLPARGTMNLRLERSIALHKRTSLEAFAEAFNLLNERSLTRVETRAFLPETPLVVNGITQPTPLVFQDAAEIATEGLNTPAFGTPTSSTSGLTRERQIEIGAHLRF